MNDLEICKRIAEIEGLKGDKFKKKGFGFGIQYDNYFRKYNPLRDDAICFKLMVKYECGIINVAKGVFVVQCKMAGTETDENTSINKAILLAIIEANKS